MANKSFSLIRKNEMKISTDTLVDMNQYPELSKLSQDHPSLKDFKFD